ncbi:MAG: GIY-YIG nuclease family protein [Bacteroidota bacterium]
MWFVYVLVSLVRNYIYVGLTHDVPARVRRHEAGRERTTRAYRPFRVLLIESHPTRGEARRREKFLKGGSGKEYLRRLRDQKPGI